MDQNSTTYLIAGNFSDEDANDLPPTHKVRGPMADFIDEVALLTEISDEVTDEQFVEFNNLAHLVC